MADEIPESETLLIPPDEVAKKQSEGSYSTLNKIPDLIRRFQVNEDMDALIGVTAPKGFGKTTLSMQIVKRYVEKHLNRSFDTRDDINRQMAWYNDDLVNKIENIDDYSPIICDEAVNFAMAEDWMKTENKDMKKTFTKMRSKHLSIFFNIPDLWWIDRKYREGMMMMWIHIVRKGYAVIFLPDLRPGIADRWHRNEFMKMRSFSFFSPVTNILSSFRKHPCYFDEFSFPKMEERIYQRYLDLREIMRGGSTEQKDTAIRKKLPVWNLYDRLNKGKELFEILKQKNGELTFGDIAELLYYDPKAKRCVPQSTIQAWTEEVRRIVEDTQKSDAYQKTQIT